MGLLHCVVLQADTDVSEAHAVSSVYVLGKPWSYSLVAKKAVIGPKGGGL